MWCFQHGLAVPPDLGGLVSWMPPSLKLRLVPWDPQRVCPPFTKLAERYLNKLHTSSIRQSRVLKMHEKYVFLPSDGTDVIGIMSRTLHFKHMRHRKKHVICWELFCQHVEGYFTFFPFCTFLGRGVKYSIIFHPSSLQESLLKDGDGSIFFFSVWHSIARKKFDIEILVTPCHFSASEINEEALNDISCYFSSLCWSWRIWQLSRTNTLPLTR